MNNKINNISNNIWTCSVILLTIAIIFYDSFYNARVLKYRIILEKYFLHDNVGITKLYSNSKNFTVTLYKLSTNYKIIQDLENENESLKSSLRLIMHNINSSDIFKSYIKENEPLFKNFKFIPTSLASYDAQYDTLLLKTTIDNAKNVKSNDLIMNESGVVGKVLTVSSSGFIKAISVHHENFQLPVLIHKNSDSRKIIALYNGQKGIAQISGSANYSPDDTIYTLNTENNKIPHGIKINNKFEKNKKNDTDMYRIGSMFYVLNNL